MRTAIFNEYGPPEVLHIVDVPKPNISDKEMLVRVKAVAVTAADSRIRGARFPRGFGFLARLIFGITKPRIQVLGSAYSGIVEQVGKDITTFRIGDEVCGMTGAKMGAYAEYIKISRFKSITKKPSKISHEDAAGVMFGGTTALYFVRDKLHVKKGESVIINGASGAVGTNAVQLAKYFGALVTGVTSTSNEGLVKSIGARQTIDYTKRDLVDGNQRYDVVIDTVGNITIETAKMLLNKDGRAGLLVANMSETLRARGPVKTGTSPERKEDIDFLLSLLEKGELKVIIDKVYAFDEIVDAHKHADSGHKVGNIVVRL